jgi:hypothetical protein
MAHKKKKAYKKVPRKDLKYPTFDVKRAVVNRREELEVDYLNKLSESEKAWLNQFQEEYVIANFGKKDDPEAKKKLLDKSDKHRKDCYNANNRRNRDVLINARVRGLTNRVESDAHLQHFIDTDKTNYNHTEDHINGFLDEKARLKKEKS